MVVSPGFFTLVLLVKQISHDISDVLRLCLSRRGFSDVVKQRLLEEVLDGRHSTLTDDLVRFAHPVASDINAVKERQILDRGGQNLQLSVRYAKRFQF